MAEKNGLEGEDESGTYRRRDGQLERVIVSVVNWMVYMGRCLIFQEIDILR